MQNVSHYLRNLFAVAAIGLLLVSACQNKPAQDGRQDAPEVTIAAAANLTDAFEYLGKQFTAQTGVRVVYSFGNTADLTSQIENEAPFDVFASADVAHIDELIRKGFIAADTRALYARGRLVLWMPAPDKLRISRIEDLTRPEVKVVAIAKPDVAPYGQATVETLHTLNLWSQVEPKVVYGMNVSQVKQYAASGNADVAFIPLSLVKAGGGEYIEVEEQLHKPINQALGIIKASNKQGMARRFVEYVLSAEGQALLEQYGYTKPSNE